MLDREGIVAEQRGHDVECGLGGLERLAVERRGHHLAQPDDPVVLQLDDDRFLLVDRRL